MFDRDLVRMTLLSIVCCLAALATAAADSPPVNPPPAAAAGEPDMNQLADRTLAQVKGRLKLTDDQIATIKPLLADHLGKVRQMFKDHSDPSGVGFPALIHEFRDRRERFRASLTPILTPAQQTEMEVIRKEVDQQLRDTICNERVAALKGRLSLSGDQEARVRPILCEDFEKKRDIMSMMTTSTGGPAARRTAQPEIESIQKQTEVRLRQVLSADQMKAYETYRDELRTSAQPGG